MPPRRPIAFYSQAARLAYRRDLPHLEQDDAVYFVTARLFDSIPLPLLKRWQDELDRWRRANPPPHTPEQVEAFADLGYRRVQRWLDRCEGSSLLADPPAREIVVTCLRNRDGVDYLLGDYAIMPNHLHVLVQLLPHVSLDAVFDAWRGVTTHRVNRLLGRTGTLWQIEPFDHIIRSGESLARIRKYIQENGQHLPPHRWTYGEGTLFAQSE